jgi:hypothetical protein
MYLLLLCMVLASFDMSDWCLCLDNSSCTLMPRSFVLRQKMDFYRDQKAAAINRLATSAIECRSWSKKK